MERNQRDRISRLLCPSCGDRAKKVAHLKNKYVGNIGFVTICCTCGRMERYCFMNEPSKGRMEGNIKSMILDDPIEVSEIRCGNKHMHCEDRNCPYWRKERMHVQQEPHHHLHKPPHPHKHHPKGRHGHPHPPRPHNTNPTSTSVYDTGYEVKNNKQKKYL